MLLFEIVQLFVVSALLYAMFKKSHADVGKRLLLLAFAAYAASLLLRLYNTSIMAGFVQLRFSELFAVTEHTFKLLFFMLFAYALMDAIVGDPMLKGITRTTAHIAISLTLIFSFGLILKEGESLAFTFTPKELVYELAEGILSLFTLNILYHSWSDTRSQKLLLSGVAFVFFLAASLGHSHNLMWGFSWDRQLIVDFLRLAGFLTLAYAAQKE